MFEDAKWIMEVDDASPGTLVTITMDARVRPQYFYVVPVLLLNRNALVTDLSICAPHWTKSFLMVMSPLEPSGTPTAKSTLEIGLRAKNHRGGAPSPSTLPIRLLIWVLTLVSYTQVA